MAQRPHGVTDEGLRHLARCAALRSVDLSGSAVTAAGMRRFLEAARAVQHVKLESCRGLSRRAETAAALGPNPAGSCAVSSSLPLL